MTIADLIGIFGVICYQIAYAGMQLGFLHREDRRYLVLNLLGPCCLLYSLLFHFNLAAAVSQVLWLVWSGLGIRKICAAQRLASVATASNSRTAIEIVSSGIDTDLAMEQVSLPSQDPLTSKPLRIPLPPRTPDVQVSDCGRPQ
jgi:hypothetical protein